MRQRTFCSLEIQLPLAKVGCLAFFISLVYFNAAVASADDWGYEGTSAAPSRGPAKSPAGTGIIPPIIEEEIEQSAAPLAKSILKPPAKPAANAKTPPGRNAGGKAGMAAAGASKTSADGAPSRPVGSPFARTTPGRTPAEGAGAGSGLNSTTAAGGAVGASLPFSRMNSGVDAAVDKNTQAARCWLQLFQACNKQAMDYGEQKRVEAYVLGKARQGGKSSEQILSILRFWPKLMADLKNKPEMEMHYSDLFRALLRLHEKDGTEKVEIEGSPYSCDSDLITALLGLERMAVSGDPSFSEDAVNAYADMAIFIYEQTHAGRTIDGPDNRTVFAKVVVQKFNDAPTDNDRRAMASFDLAWAKFKIIWNDSNEETRKILLDKLVHKGAASSLTVSKDPLLDVVLSNWPWKTMP